jgi:hypothetical protein
VCAASARPPAWSLYSSRGAESTLGYHRLVESFLGVMCRRSGRPEYCVTQRRFARYEREPPRIRIRRPARVRRGRPMAIGFSLSKVSRVRVVIRDRRGVRLRRDLRLAHGRHTLRWTPSRRAPARLRILAIGPGGTRAIVTHTLLAAPARKGDQARTK